MECYS